MNPSLIMKSNKLEVYIFSDVSARWGFSSKELAEALKGVSKNTPIDVYINSPGGEVFDGLAIYNLLAERQNVTTIVTGIAASIASVILLAGQTRKIYDNAMVMIHNPLFASLSGNRVELENQIDLLKKTEANVFSVYSSRTGNSSEQISDWLTKDTYFSAEEALAYGFVTEIIEAPKIENVSTQGNLIMATENDQITALRTKVANEEQRIDGIKASYDQLQHNEHTLNPEYTQTLGLPDSNLGTLKAHAIRSGWTQDKFELEARRAEKVSVGNFSVKSYAPPTDKTLQAALALHLGYGEQVYDAPTLECAKNLGVRHFLDVVRLQLQTQGKFRTSDNVYEMLKASATSTTNYTTLLGDSANRELAQIYSAAESIAKKISKVLSANDFKTHYMVALKDFDAKPETIGADGEIKHSRLSDRSTTYSIDTYARLVEIARKDLINDDLGAMSELPSMLARGAVTQVEKVFWTMVLANASSFFGTGNKNYIDGAASTLQISSLSAAVAKLMAQVDSVNDPIGVQPKYLVVPPALLADAMVIYNSVEMRLSPANTGTGNVGVANPWCKSFEPLCSPWLGVAAGLAGATDVAWYLWGNPLQLATTGIAYLNGTSVPMVEHVELAENRLGEGWRSVFDFGTCLIEPKASVKVKGSV
ncbi:MAG: head maturation protease, ClpP-related [Pirellulaceae bacterium]